MLNSKHRKLRTIQMNYPAPYSQSWANTEPAIAGADTMKKCALQGNRNKLNQPRPTYNCCWRRPKPLTHGCDPYAPHLKYGLFPRKVSLREPLIKPPMDKNTKSLKEDVRNNITMGKFMRDRQMAYRKERRHCTAPLLVIRATDPQRTRRLSMSTVTHIDIQPFSRQTPFWSVPVKPPSFPRALSPLSARLRRRQRASTRY